MAASYSRYSSDHQREESITDQQRTCRVLAEKNGHRLLTEFEFGDEAVSGTKLRRAGLDALLKAAAAGEFQVLYFHSLSRLARESVITMPILKRLVYTHRVRVISVTEAIDSDRDGWEVIASVMSLLHERYIKELGENVFRGQEGTVLAGLCVGDQRFGYRSVPLEGDNGGGKGHNLKPRMVYAVDESTAAWVIRIFHWFVVERQTVAWIAKELNRCGAPKDHRASTKHWYHQLVTQLLSCPKYIGEWPWGEKKNTRDPETGKVHQEARSEEECQKWRRNFPHLRIIDDETFNQAQQLLQQNEARHGGHRQPDGTLRGSSGNRSDYSLRHLLSGLIVCGECGHTLNISGPGGAYLACPNYAKGTCSCQTKLQRERAERLIVSAVDQRLVDCPQWFRASWEKQLEDWQANAEGVPAELAAAQCALEETQQKITRLVDSIENGISDPEIQSRLSDRREEQRVLLKSVNQLQQSCVTPGQPPTEQSFRDQLAQIRALLQDRTPAAALALRGLVGGKIVVQEIRNPGRKRFFLRGRFVLHPLAVIGATSPLTLASVNNAAGQVEAAAEEIVIDFVDPSRFAKDAAKARELYDLDLPLIAIARRIPCSKNHFTKLLKYSFELSGEPMPDGRARRAKLTQKFSEPPPYQKIAADVLRLSQEGLYIYQIAAELGYDCNTVTAAMAFAQKATGGEVVDGRTRRKTLPHKGRQRKNSKESPPEPPSADT